MERSVIRGCSSRRNFSRIALRSIRATRLPLIRPHPLYHLLDMRDRGFRLDAVAEVENQSAASVVRQHVVDGTVERRTARNQRQRIEIALHRDAVLNALADQ